MGNLHVHAIQGSMIVAEGGACKLLEIRRSVGELPVVFVVAPLCDPTLELSSLLDNARDHDERLWAAMEERTSAWNSRIDSLLAQEQRQTVRDLVSRGFGAVEDILRSVWLVGDVSKGARRYVDSIVGGWTAHILSRAFAANSYPCSMVEYSEFLRAQDLDLSLHATTLIHGDLPQVGAGASQCPSGEYAAALLGDRLEAANITFWNPDQLVTTADITDVPSATVIPCITYAEATELSFFGAKVIHPQHMVPAIAKKIPLYLRSFADHKHAGTFVDDEKGRKSAKPVKGFSVIREVALVNVEGAGMIGVPGIAQRLFAAMREAGISVILISQASSEYSICFAVPAEQAAFACATARSTFSPEIAQNKIHRVEVELGCAILAAVGEHMPGVPGIAGTFFSSLGKARVNVRAIAQGSSERNISAVIKEEDARKALRALHAGFFLSNQTLSVGLFGPGNIGGTLLDQIATEARRLSGHAGVDIRIRGIANSRRMLLDDQGVDLSRWRDEFDRHAVPFDLKRFEHHVNASYFPQAVMVDCTASAELAKRYAEWMEHGMHVITPNKKAGTAPYAQYRRLMEAKRVNGRYFLYETTVGAGLPVVGALKDLIQTGDRVRSVEGIVSGTLAYLFSRYDATVPFSTLVRNAKERGFTEPDPRDDLSGMDVARKTVILAREIGYRVEVEDVPVVSLVPEALRDVPLEQFLAQMEMMDEPMEHMYRSAASQGKILRYVGKVDSIGDCSVELGMYGQDHPFANSKGTDNVVVFTTDRYQLQPLVIQGPGAGPDVTAAGVFADLLRLSAYLGARL